MFSDFDFLDFDGVHRTAHLQPNVLYRVQSGVHDIHKKYTVPGNDAFAGLLASMVTDGAMAGMYSAVLYPGAAVQVHRRELKRQVVLAEKSAEALRKEWQRLSRRGESDQASKAAQATEEARAEVMELGNKLNDLDGIMQTRAALESIMRDVRRFNFSAFTKLSPSSTQYIPFLKDNPDPDYGDFLGRFVFFHSKMSGDPRERLSVSAK